MDDNAGLDERRNRRRKLALKPCDGDGLVQHHRAIRRHCRTIKRQVFVFTVRKRPLEGAGIVDQRRLAGGQRLVRCLRTHSEAPSWTVNAKSSGNRSVVSRSQTLNGSGAAARASAALTTWVIAS